MKNEFEVLKVKLAPESTCWLETWLDPSLMSCLGESFHTVILKYIMNQNPKTKKCSAKWKRNGKRNPVAMPTTHHRSQAPFQTPGGVVGHHLLCATMTRTAMGPRPSPLLPFLRAVLGILYRYKASRVGVGLFLKAWGCVRACKAAEVL